MSISLSQKGLKRRLFLPCFLGDSSNLKCRHKHEIFNTGLEIIILQLLYFEKCYKHEAWKSTFMPLNKWRNPITFKFIWQCEYQFQCILVVFFFYGIDYNNTTLGIPWCQPDRLYKHFPKYSKSLFPFIDAPGVWSRERVWIQECWRGFSGNHELLWAMMPKFVKNKFLAFSSRVQVIDNIPSCLSLCRGGKWQI